MKFVEEVAEMLFREISTWIPKVRFGKKGRGERRWEAAGMVIGRGEMNKPV